MRHLVYALAAPLSAALVGRLDRRALLTGALLLFCAANFVVPLVDSYPLLMALRVVAARAAAAVLPAALALATHLAPEGATGRHLATVMAGMTGAIVLGVPAGTWVGAAFGWRATFVLGGALGLLAILVWLPRTTLDRPPSPVLKVLAVTVVAVAGNLAFQTYLATFLAGLSGVTPAVLGVLLVVAGLAGIAGARLAGTVVDRWGVRRCCRGVRAGHGRFAATSGAVVADRRAARHVVRRLGHTAPPSRRSCSPAVPVFAAVGLSRT